MFQNRLRRVLLASALLTAGAAAFAGSAQAATYCVLPATGCDVASPSLIAALDAAVATDSVEDTVRLGSTNYTIPGTGYTWGNQTPGNEIHIVGNGSANTSVTWADTTGTSVGLTFFAAPGSDISDLKLKVPDNNEAVDGDTAIKLGNGVDADNIAVVGGVNTKNARGIWTYGGDITSSTVTLPTGETDSNIGVDQSNNGYSIDKSSIEASYAARTSSPGLVATITNSRLKGAYGASTEGGKFVIRNTLIEVTSESGAVGLLLKSPNNGAGVMSADLDGVTIAGSDFAGTKGIQAEALLDNFGTQSATVDVTNTVISGVQNTFWLNAADGGTVTTNVTNSAINNGQSSITTGPNGGTIHNNLGTGFFDLESDPLYKDPATGDYTPQPGSPLIDVGDPATPAAGATDISGTTPRACHGDGKGIIRRDIGAFEYRTNPADDCTYPQTTLTGPATVTEGDDLSLNLTSSKPNSTFTCSKAGQTTFTCTAPLLIKSITSGGQYLAQAIDAYGNLDPTPAAHNVTVVPKTTGPGPDTTKPKIIKLKAAKKTKKKRVVVRFKSNEKKVVFTCQLNRKSPKRCKSPWKTPKLKKGKNTVSVWATDSSGNRSGIKKRVIRRK